MPDQNNTSAPRGTERVARREAQAKHAEQAVQEAATLIPPQGEEKKRKIAENKEAQKLRDGAQSPVKARQAANRDAALEQDRQFAGAAVLQQAKLIPGQQVDHRTARMLAKATDRVARDQITDAARAAGRAVRDTLNDRASAGGEGSIFRKAARHNAKNAATTKTT